LQDVSSPEIEGHNFTQRIIESIVVSNPREDQFNFEIDPPAFILTAETNLIDELHECAEDLRWKAFQALNESITILAKRLESAAQFSQPDQEPITLLTNYWQLIWCKVSGIVLDSATQAVVLNALTNAQKGPHLLAVRAAEVFKAIREVDDLLYLMGILSAIKKLNQGLVVIPPADDSEVSTIYIPPLPEGAVYPEGTPELDDSAIDSWIDIINGWITIFQNQLKENAPVNTCLAIQQAQQLQQDFQYLKVVWLNRF
jgi:hypothetical protein